MEKIYCIIFFPFLRRAVALDRGYNYITDDKAEWGKVNLQDTIEFDEHFFAGQGIPAWAYLAYKEKHGHVAIWTNYYE